MDSTAVNEIYKSLRKKYLLVYLLASFADWLQGPYLYRLYASYGYQRDEISLLYVAGFASGTISGILIGHFADTFGRKRLCMIYSLTTTLTCLTISITNEYAFLLLARVSGGASTCILFSTFESWYVGQHLSHYRLDDDLIADILTKSTFYNGFLAILAGISSSLLADSLEYGPLAPFLLAAPVSLLAGFFCSILWHENRPVDKEYSSFSSNLTESLDLLLFSNKKNLLLLLGASQSIFETVMYIFVFLWTPILDPLEISHGLVFGAFMLCIMIGSGFNSFLASKYRMRRENLLCLSVFLGAFSIFGSTIGVYLQEKSEREKIEGSYFSLFSFLLFEISVGIYYPAIGYLRGIVVPESHRASIANWFRLPSNTFICLTLFYIGIKTPGNCIIFAACSFALVVASITAKKFARLFSQISNYRSIAKLPESFFL